MWLDRIIPVAVECVPLEIDGGEFLVGYLNPFGIGGIVQFGMHGKPLARRGMANQIDNHGSADEWLGAPVLRDMAKQAMLDLIPFARSGWEMTHRD